MVGRAVDGQCVFSLHLFSDIFDGWCGLWPVLSCCCLLLFGSWVDFWSFWGCLGSIFGRFGGSEGGLGRPLGVSWRVLGATWAGLRPSWAVIGCKGRFRPSKGPKRD